MGAGLLDYPVLMAADILLYDTDEVPVGEDQQQHVELARDIAERFNRLHGELFVIPAAVIPAAGARVMGLDDPTVKMSKSFAHVNGHAIRILDEPDAVRRVISRAVTDSGKEIRFSDDPARAGVNNLLGIYQAITGKPAPAVEADFAGARGYGDLKRGSRTSSSRSWRRSGSGTRRSCRIPRELDRLLARGRTAPARSPAEARRDEAADGARSCPRNGARPYTPAPAVDSDTAPSRPASITPARCGGAPCGRTPISAGRIVPAGSRDGARAGQEGCAVSTGPYSER